MKNDYKILGDTVVIYLDKADGQRLETIIDIDYFDKVSSLGTKWVALKSGSNDYYAKAQKQINNKITRVLMHRMITDCPEGMVVDHINHNKLDNRKENLRVTTPYGNSQNVLREDGVGVYWMKRYKKWEVRLGTGIYVGRYDTKEEAIEKSRLARAELWPLSPEAQLITVDPAQSVIRGDDDPQRESKSGVRNVHYNKRTRKYTVRIYKDKISHYCGEYRTIEEAKKVAAEMRKKIFESQLAELQK